MSEWIGLGLTSGQTRDCMDPWGYVQAKSNGQILPCCAHDGIGWIVPDRSLYESCNDDAAQALRASLLVGELDKSCQGCSIKSPIGIAEYRKKFARWLLDTNQIKENTLKLDDHNEIPGFVKFKNVLPGCFDFNSAVSFHARPISDPQPSVLFYNVAWEEHDQLDIFVKVPSESSVLQCSILVGADEDTVVTHATAEVLPGCEHQFIIDLPSLYHTGVIALTACSNGENFNLPPSLCEWTIPLVRQSSLKGLRRRHISFSADINPEPSMFQKGFSFQEPDGRWTEGRHAALCFDLSIDEKPIYIVINASTLGAPGNRFRRVKISADGQFLKNVVYGHGAPNPNLQLGLRSYAGHEGAKELIIDIEIENPLIPNEFGLNADVRELGLFIQGIELISRG